MSIFKKLAYIFWSDIWFLMNTVFFVWFNTKSPRFVFELNFSFPKMFVVLSAVLFVVSIIISIVKKKFGICELSTVFALISSAVYWLGNNIISIHYMYEYPALDLIFRIPLLIYAIIAWVKIIRLIVAYIKKAKNRTT